MIEQGLQSISPRFVHRPDDLKKVQQLFAGAKQQLGAPDTCWARLALTPTQQPCSYINSVAARDAKTTRSSLSSRFCRSDLLKFVRLPRNTDALATVPLSRSKKQV